MCAAAAAVVVAAAEITTDAVWIICLDLSLFLSRFFLVKSGREYRLRSICPIAELLLLLLYSGVHFGLRAHRATLQIYCL